MVVFYDFLFRLLGMLRVGMSLRLKQLVRYSPLVLEGYIIEHRPQEMKLIFSIINVSINFREDIRWCPRS